MLDETKRVLIDLIESQRFAVVASQSKGQPYCSLVAFSSSKDLRHLFFATPRYTRKYSNLLKKARSAMLVDSRSNKADDISKAVAVTAIGMVKEMKGTLRTRYLEEYLAKHPHMRTFATSPSCSMLVMEVERYYVVSKFQNVLELDVKK